jgi:hypothetical protein
MLDEEDLSQLTEGEAVEEPLLTGVELEHCRAPLEEGRSRKDSFR